MYHYAAQTKTLCVGFYKKYTIVKKIIFIPAGDWQELICSVLMYLWNLFTCSTNQHWKKLVVVCVALRQQAAHVFLTLSSRLFLMCLSDSGCWLLRSNRKHEPPPSATSGCNKHVSPCCHLVLCWDMFHHTHADTQMQSFLWYHSVSSLLTKVVQNRPWFDCISGHNCKDTTQTVKQAPDGGQCDHGYHVFHAGPESHNKWLTLVIDVSQLTVDIINEMWEKNSQLKWLFLVSVRRGGSKYVLCMEPDSGH